MQTSSERRPATTKSHAHVGTPRRSASGVTDRIAGMLASALRAAVSSLSAAHAGAVGHVACDHVVTLLMFARWCECHGTTTPAMRSTGRAITLVSQTLGHADPETTSVYAQSGRTTAPADISRRRDAEPLTAHAKGSFGSKRYLQAGSRGWRLSPAPSPERRRSASSSAANRSTIGFGSEASTG
jgi:hypothetical protein